MALRKRPITECLTSSLLNKQKCCWSLVIEHTDAIVKNTA